MTNSIFATRKRDTDYLDAVESGDAKKAEQMVKESAKEAMPNTKAVDEEGNPIKVYHYGNKGINVFDREKARTTYVYKKKKLSHRRHRMGHPKWTPDNLKRGQTYCERDFCRQKYNIFFK